MDIEISILIICNSSIFSWTQFNYIYPTLIHWNKFCLGQQGLPQSSGHCTQTCQILLNRVALSFLESHVSLGFKCFIPSAFSPTVLSHFSFKPFFKPLPSKIQYTQGLSIKISFLYSFSPIECIGQHIQ